jgi:membrane glycosyltransferase
MIAALPVPAWRPVLFFLSVGLTIVGLVWIAAIALARRARSTRHRSSGVVRRDPALVRDWFLNATIGLLIMRFARDPVAAVTPVAGRVRGDEPITASTAILLCIRNEPTERGRGCSSR